MSDIEPTPYSHTTVRTFTHGLSAKQKVRIIRPFALLYTDATGQFSIRDGRYNISSKFRSHSQAWADAAKRLGYE